MVESEQHVLLKCPLYEDLQFEMYGQVFKNLGFYSSTEEETIIFLYSSKDMIKTVAKKLLRRFRQVKTLFIQMMWISYFICMSSCLITLFE